MLKRLKADKFIQNNIVFFFGSLAVAFLNYLYHPILGRMMKIEDFGEVQAFISFTLIFSVFAGLFRNVIVSLVANYSGNEADKKTILRLQTLSLYFVLLISAVLLIFNNYFLALFKLDSAYFFLALALLLIIGVLATTSQAILQGLHRFQILSFSSALASAAKIALAVLAVYFGFGIMGAVSGLVLAALISLIYSYYYSNKLFSLAGGEIAIKGRIRKELWYTFLVFTATLAITFLYTADTVIVKRYFPADIAGYYSGIATIGRIIFFLTGSVAGVLLPAIKINDTEGKNKKTLIKAVVLTSLLGGGTWLTFSLFPGSLINLLIGQRYSQFASFLPEVSLFLFVVSLANLLFFYLLALRSKFVLWPAVLGPLATVVLSFLSHKTIANIINNFLIGSLIVLVMLASKIISDILRKKYEQANISNNS